MDDNFRFWLTLSAVATFVADAAFDAAHDGVLQGDDTDGSHDDDGTGNLYCKIIAKGQQSCVVNNNIN